MKTVENTQRLLLAGSCWIRKANGKYLIANMPVRIRSLQPCVWRCLKSEGFKCNCQKIIYLYDYLNRFDGVMNPYERCHLEFESVVQEYHPLPENRGGNPR